MYIVSDGRRNCFHIPPVFYQQSKGILHTLPAAILFDIGSPVYDLGYGHRMLQIHFLECDHTGCNP